MKISGKTALVLGAAKGIGKEIGLALAAAGARVVLTYYDWPEAASRMQDEFSSLGFDHTAVKVDLRDPAQIDKLFEKIRTQYGGLDILINNIERGGMPVVHGPYTPEQWDLEMETTLKAKWFIFNQALPLLKKAGEGVAITFSSISGIVGRSGPAGLIFNDGYSAANRAISSFTETWARQGAPEVRVNELMLGFFETRHAEKTRGWPLLSKEEQDAILNHTLLKRSGKISEIIKAVFFLIEDATFMTGSTLRIDGGFPLGGESIPAMPDGVL
ncbi:MAG: SDR family oxidoreductase [Desulfobulbaceae bacterium]|nr:SDR family oxidoreductase [Desulfobulbaceae bacterium]